MTNDELARILLGWPPGTEVTVRVDVNMSVDIEAVSETGQWDPGRGRNVPHILIELPTPDISTVPPLRVVPFD